MKTIERPISFSFLIWATLIVLLGVFLRVYQLDVRPFHHDESLHATYGLYYFVDAANLYYKYDPMLHGPWLYHIIPWAYHFFGISKFSARLVTALFSMVLFIAPLFFRSRLGNRRTIELMLFLAFAPSLVYWGRFLRHDLLMIAVMSGAMISLLIRHEWLRYLSFFSLLALSFCIKENSYVHLLLVFVYIIFEFCVKLRNSHETFLIKIINDISRNKLPLFFALLCAGTIYCYYYSAGFVYWDGVIDGLYRKSLTYWFDQHHKERISGPFSFNSLMITWYEIPLLFMFIIFFIHHVITSEFFEKIGLMIALFMATSTHFFLDKAPLADFISVWLKIKIPLDCYLFWFYLYFGITVTVRHISEDRQHLAFLGYLFFSFLFTYSYLGEKVPWLSMYPIIFGYLYLWLYIRYIIGRWPAAIIMATFQGLNFWLCFQLNFISSGSMNEIISQVHTSRSYETFASELADKLRTQNSSVLALDSNTWPLTWFLYGLPGYVFTKDVTDYSNYEHILVDLPDLQWENKLSQTHVREIVPIRHWWWPEFDKMSFGKVFRYYFTRKGWNSPGEKFIAHYRKRLTSEPSDSSQSDSSPAP